jgi:hypothetical protein
MKDGFLPWSNFHGPIFVKINKNQFTKPLGPSLGVNRVWTKRNNYAPKIECVGFFNICPKRTILEKQ